MARWDKFLNQASRGYGVGFDRYQQYADARDKRLNRADMQAVAASMQDLENAEAVPVHGSQIVFEDARVPTVPQTPTATGGGAPTAVPTSPVEPATPPPAMLDRDPARRDLAGSAMGYADSYMTPYEAPPPERDPVRGAMTLGGVSQERQQEILDRGRQAELAAGLGEFGGGPPLRAEGEEKPKAVEESTKKGEGKTAAVSANQALQEVALQSDSNKGKVPIKLDVTKYSTDTPTAEIWNNVRDKLMQVAIRNGDYESVINMPEKIAGMQQQGFMRNMEQALQVQDDPEALAAVLTKAYSYYPDGVALQFQVQDGQLYGYGFDEATGEFQGGTLIDGEAIASAMEQASDPVTFYKEKRAAELAAQERREAKEWKQKEYTLEVYKAEDAAATNAAKRFHSVAQGNKIYAEMKGLDGGSMLAWENGWKDVQANQTQAVESLNKAYQSKQWPDPRLEMLMAEDGLGSRRMHKIVSSIAGNTTPDQGLGMEVVPMYAAAVGELELLNSQVQSGDADQDEFFEAIKRNNIQHVFLTPAGNVNMTVDGMPLEVNSGLVPGIAKLLKTGGMQKSAAPQAAVSPYAPVEGQPLDTKQALGVIGTRAGEAAGVAGDAVKTVAGYTPAALYTKGAINLGKKGIQGLGEALR